MLHIFLDESGARDDVEFEKRAQSLVESIKNEGFLLGKFSHLNPYIRTISVSAAFGVLFFIFFLVQYFITMPLNTFRYGLSISMGGIIGNVIDRAYLGIVRDFISIYPNIYFNLADVFLTWGGLLFIASLYKNKDELWHPGCIRHFFFLNSKAHLLFSMQMSLIVFIISCSLLIFSISYMTTIGVEQNEVAAYCLISISISIMFCLITFFVGMLLSHRFTGPLYAFEKYISSLLNGDNPSPLKLRSGDHHKQLVEIAQKIKNYIEKK